jgi:hypothetical protein
MSFEIWKVQMKNKKDVLSGSFMNIPAGIELDALVAENIMGIEILHNPKSAISNGCRVSAGTWAVIEKNYHEWGDDVERPHKYSSDVLAMWEVIEKLSQINNGDISINFYQRKSFAPRWRCDLTLGSHAPLQGWAESAPLALCRIALMAIVNIR